MGLGRGVTCYPSFWDAAYVAERVRQGLREPSEPIGGRTLQPGGAKNSSALLSGSRNERPDP